MYPTPENALLTPIKLFGTSTEHPVTLQVLNKSGVVIEPGGTCHGVASGIWLKPIGQEVIVSRLGLGTRFWANKEPEFPARIIAKQKFFICLLFIILPN